MRVRALLRRKGDLFRDATIVELGFWDVVQLLLGREVELWAYSELVVIRVSPNYEAFNLTAGGQHEAIKGS